MTKVFVEQPWLHQVARNTNNTGNLTTILRGIGNTTLEEDANTMLGWDREGGQKNSSWAVANNLGTARILCPKILIRPLYFRQAQIPIPSMFRNSES